LLGNKMKKVSYLFFLIDFIFFAKASAQTKQIVSLTTGNYWIYYENNRSSGSTWEYYIIKKAIGDTVKDGKPFKIIDVNGKHEYWYSDENVFNTNFDKRIIRDTAYYLMGNSYRTHIDSIFCFDKKYRSNSNSYYNYDNLYYSDATYCEKFGLISKDGGGRGSSNWTRLRQAYIDGIMYGKYPSPLKVVSWSSDKERLNIKFSSQWNYFPHTKIIIYKSDYLNGSVTKYDSIGTSTLNPIIEVPPGNYYLRFSYRTADGFESALSEATLVTVKRTKPVVSTSTGNYWIYRNNEVINGSVESYYSIYKTIKDTTIQNIPLKKVLIQQYRDSGLKTSDIYYYSDTTYFRQYDKTGHAVYSLYIRTGQNPVETVFGQPFPKTNASQDTAIVFVNNIPHSGYDKITSYERLGMGYRKWTHLINSVLTSQKEQTLVGARIDSKTYGSVLPPPQIASWQVENRSVQINMSYLTQIEQVDKIIIYKYITGPNTYKAVDSIKYTDWQGKYDYEFGENKFRFAYRTKEGIESLPSETISFSKAPADFKLSQNYPNPFNGQTKIQFELGSPADVELDVINVLGQSIYSERKVISQRGYYEFNLRMENLPSGIYFYRITTSTGFNQTNKMVLMK
jgi:hypothetical protein